MSSSSSPSPLPPISRKRNSAGPLENAPSLRDKRDHKRAMLRFQFSRFEDSVSALLTQQDKLIDKLMHIITKQAELYSLSELEREVVDSEDDDDGDDGLDDEKEEEEEGAIVVTAFPSVTSSSSSSS